MTPTPTISIIIPTYNRKVFLYETLDSLTRQNFPAAHFEVIVVDDGSTDETSSVIDQTLHSFPTRRSSDLTHLPLYLIKQSAQVELVYELDRKSVV